MPIDVLHQHAWWLQAAPGDLGNGTIISPSAVVAGRGDPLFSFDHTQQVFGRIATPAKELVIS